MVVFQQLIDWVKGLPPNLIEQVLRVGLTLVLGVLLVRLLAAVTRRSLLRKSTPQRQMIARKAITYTGFLLIAMAVLAELGVKLTALLGAAGIVGIAVGFASQTSVSNIISGLFLISEKPFAVGDVIRVGTTTGIIQSIDLLSIKIRTFDNLFVRIPNEKILSSEVTNITRFPVRRMDIVLQVSYDEDLDAVRRVLGEVAGANPWCLDDPAPVILVSDFRESGVEVLFGLWFARDDFLELRNTIMRDVLEAFRRAAIRIAVPRRSVAIAEAAAGTAPRGGAAGKGPRGARPAVARRRRLLSAG